MRFEVPPAERLRAKLYAATHRGNPHDVDFYVHEAIGAAEVLELGCGTGRVLRALAAAGARVTGLDSDVAMLAEAEASLTPGLAPLVELVHGDMRRFDLGRRFDRVFIPYNAVFALPTDEAAARCFELVRRHLAPGGRLAFDVYTIDDVEDWCSPRQTDYELLLTLVHEGQRVDLYERERPGPAKQTLDVTYRYVLDAGAGRAPHTLTYRIRHHALPLPALERLLHGAGLDVLSVWGDFDRSPPNPAGERYVIRAGPRADDAQELER